MGMTVLLSAMHLDDESYIDTLNIHTDCVVINQCDRQCSRQVTHTTAKGPVRITYVETKERGLSKSRNEAIRNATESICILCDNDVEYADNYDTIVKDAFLRHEDADVILFKVLLEIPYYLQWSEGGAECSGRCHGDIGINYRQESCIFIDFFTRKSAGIT